MEKNYFLLLCILCLLYNTSEAQTISVYQYRKVADENISEFIHRETTYWSKVAQKAIDDGKLNQWILLQKVGGYDLPNSSNFLFINAFPDINVNIGEVWNAGNVFPDVPMSAIETNSLSTTITMAFVQPMEWEEVEGANAAEDFNFVKFNYWNTSNPNQFVNLEKEHWGPFINAEMEKEGCNQVAWGNAVIINPRGPNIPGNTISFDIYPTLKDVLLPSFSDDVVFPQEGLNKLGELVTSRTEAIYQVVMAVTK